jgi:hypothetical protein
VDEVGGKVGCAVLCIHQSNPAHAEVSHRQNPMTTSNQESRPARHRHEDTI